MGRLVIAHHKSYHPYRRDNVERVRRDEEAAALQEEKDEGRIRLADAEARIDLLRERAGVAAKKKKKRLNPEEEMEDARRAVAAVSDLPLSAGHINLFQDLEQTASGSARPPKPPPLTDDEKGVRLAPSQKDRSPWYSTTQPAVPVDERRRTRDERRKTTQDPLTLIQTSLAASSRPSSSRPPASRTAPRPAAEDDPYAPALPRAPVDLSAARLAREAAERARADALLGRHAPRAAPRGADMYNRADVEAARATRRDADGRTRDRRW